MSFDYVTSGNGEKRDLLSGCTSYVALVTDSFLSEENCLGEMKDAHELKKPMFALVQKDTKLPDDFFNYNWKLILFFHTEKEYLLACGFLKQFLGELDP